MLLGVILGFVIRGKSVCHRGYLSLQLMILWLRIGLQYAYPCVYSSQGAEHKDLNRSVAELNRATSVPRVVHVGRPRIAHYVMLSVVSGLTDALSLTMGAAAGDSHMLSLAALALSSRATRLPSLCLAVYVFLSQPLPLVHGILRGLLTAISVLSSLAILPRQWAVFRIGVASAVAMSAAGPCLSQVGSISPALLISFSLYSLRVNPVSLLTFAVFVNL